VSSQGAFLAGLTRALVTAITMAPAPRFYRRELGGLLPGLACDKVTILSKSPNPARLIMIFMNLQLKIGAIDER